MKIEVTSADGRKTCAFTAVFDDDEIEKDAVIDVALRVQALIFLEGDWKRCEECLAIFGQERIVECRDDGIERCEQCRKRRD